MKATKAMKATKDRNCVYCGGETGSRQWAIVRTYGIRAKWIHMDCGLRWRGLGFLDSVWPQEQLAEFDWERLEWYAGGFEWLEMLKEMGLYQRVWWICEELAVTAGRKAG